VRGLLGRLICCDRGQVSRCDAGRASVGRRLPLLWGDLDFFVVMRASA
jgi:hypothetical protein